MTLTADEFRSAATGDNVRFSQSGIEFVVIRAEDFKKMKDGLDEDYQELRMMLARSSEDNGWNEPGMEAYDSYPAQS